MRVTTALAALLAPAFSSVAALAATSESLVSAAELNVALWTNSTAMALRPFALRGVLTARIFSNEFVFEDATGRFLLHLDPGQSPRVGDIVSITGHISAQPIFRREAWSKTLTVVGHTNVPTVVERPLASLRGNACQALPVITSGLVEEAFRDEVDPSWFILLLRDGAATIPVSVRDDGTCCDLPARLFGRRVRVRGICLYNIKGERLYTGLRILVTDQNDITIGPAGERDAKTLATVDF